MSATDNGGTANGGQDTSAPQTFTITVLWRNIAPAFIVGPDESSVLSLGARTIPGWATGIDPGSPDESGQSITFTVTNDNNGLFVVQPAVSPSGTLTYTPTLLGIGTAIVTVTAHDDGGTANGGATPARPRPSRSRSSLARSYFFGVQVTPEPLFRTRQLRSITFAFVRARTSPRTSLSTCAT